MKAFKLIITASLLTASAFAQTVEFVEPRSLLVAVMPEISTFKVKDITYVMYDYYNKSTLKTDVQLDAYDINMKFNGTSLINKTENPETEPTIFEGVFALSDKLVLFKSEWDKKTGNALSVFPVNANAAKQSETKLCDFPAEKMMNTGYFRINVSPDGSKFVVLCELPWVKDSLERTIVYVYDNNFKQLWTKEYRFPNANGTEKYRYNDVFVNNAGVVFDMKRVPVKKSLDYFTVFTFFNNGTKVEERKMDLGEGGHISTYRSGFCSNGDLLMCGYYYPDKKVGVNVETPSGAFYVKVSAADGGMPIDKLTPITPNAAIKANYLLVLADNSAILVGENEYVTSTLKPGATPGMAGGDSDFDYNNTNIFALKFGSDGVKKWEHMIDRDMKSRNDGGRTLGIFACMVGENLVITYQDFIYKHDGKPHMVAAGADFWRVNVVRKINDLGITVSEAYINDKRLAGRDADYALLPCTGVKLSETTLWFISARGLELVSTKIIL